MLSVIELAQLLTGALDERFNITNKTAVLQVVSCLEAFNITHESYREVQNTRIIKDLQALRQNKANDQQLAKRIKNLLRKWKERLATYSSVVQPSQPNSPQNMSQGSSDTQFMTQQSQSPPISQLPNHKRIVNGPTTFSNLLPKHQQHQQTSQNHLPIKMPMTSPVPVHYQNGTMSSQDSSQSLLGKRKLEAPATVGDVDENSNHSRKKMMKKSNTSAIASPLSLNPNNSTINHNHQINQPIPTVPVQQTPEPAPKKRGRKKGSKGIDSMLNGTIPDFQTEMKLKIASSIENRIKPTMEIQRKFESSHQQNTSMSWTNGNIDSSSLDRGFNSLSSSHQPETSHGDEFHAHIKKEIKEEQKLESVPSQSLAASNTSRSLNIEDEIARLRAQLPPVDYEAAERDTFEEYNTIDNDGEPVECTCTFQEMITYLGADEKDPDAAVVQEEPKIDVNIIKNGESEKLEDTDEDETDDFCAVDDEDDDEVLKSPPPVRGAVKSIFDPEYDANENLIEEMVRRKPRDNASKVIEVKIEKGAVKPLRIDPLLLQQPEQQTPEIERVPIINYVCEEDPMCPARAHFQHDPVTPEDVHRLHTRFINGVNGYWNGIPEEKPPQDYSKDMENIDYAKHRLWKRVVPRYDFLTCDKIPKNLDNKNSSIPPPPPDDDEGSSDGSKKKKKSDTDIEFREWHEVMNVRSFNDDVLTILPYVIID